MSRSDQARRFRALHGISLTLVLPSAWNAGSARLIESCGAEAIATTSAGVAWASGYPDGDAIPPSALADAGAVGVNLEDGAGAPDREAQSIR